MTLASIAVLPAKPDISFAVTLKRVLAMSWPIVLGSLSMAALNVGQIGILGNIADPKPLYAMSILQPYYLLFFAFLEALAITAQVFAARSQKLWKRGNVRMACFALALIGLGLVGGLSLVADRAVLSIAAMWPVAGNDAAPLIAPYLLSLTPLLVFEIINGALRGSGRTLPGFLILGITVALNLGLTWLYVVEKGQGLDGIFLANLLSGLPAILAASLVLARIHHRAESGPLMQAIIRLGTLLGVVGLPVFASMAVSFVSSAILIDRILGFGEMDAAAFVIVVRLRYFFLIPAIAMATSVAVLINQNADGSGRSTITRATLMNGFLVILIAYLFLTAVLYGGREVLMHLLAADPALSETATSILTILLPTFAMAGLVASFQLILENLGRGGRVLFWTLLLEGATCAAIIYHAGNLADALSIILISAAAYTLVFGLEYTGLVLANRAPRETNVAGAAGLTVGQAE